MEHSLFLAKLVGLYTVVICLAGIVNRHHWRALVNELNQAPHLMGMFAGSIALLFGLFIILTHNVWTPDWRGLITLMGWVGILKGLLRLFFMDWLMRVSKSIVDGSWYMLVMVVFLVIGAYLTYVGFVGM